MNKETMKLNNELSIAKDYIAILECHYKIANHNMLVLMEWIDNNTHPNGITALEILEVSKNNS